MIQLADINKHIIEDIENPHHPSEFLQEDNYSVLIVRLPEIQEDQVNVTSFAFVIDDKEVYNYDRDSQKLIPLGNFDRLVDFLDPKIDLLLKEIQLYHFHIELLEDSLYEDNLGDRFMHQWLEYKKALSLVNRVVFHTSLAFELFVKHYKNKKEFDHFAFEDLLEHQNRILNLSNAAKEKLDNLYDFYRAKVDERMNKNMYYLTILSGVFLPLTLITGFFGMNTSGLPLTTGSDGTFKAVIISIILEVLFIVPFIIVNKRRFKKY